MNEILKNKIIVKRLKNEGGLLGDPIGWDVKAQKNGSFEIKDINYHLAIIASSKENAKITGLG